MARQKIFICYRRIHSDAARLLFERAKLRFGRGHVFMDVHNISDSVDFTLIVRSEIRRTAAMIVVVGPGWADLKDQYGERRLSRPNDPVRREIHEALLQDVPIFPVLVGKSEMPLAEELPEEIRAFATRSARQLPNDDLYDEAVDRLLGNVRGRMSGPKRLRSNASLVLGAGTLAAIGLAVFFYIDSVGRNFVKSPSQPVSNAVEYRPIGLRSPIKPDLITAKSVENAQPQGLAIIDCTSCPELVVLAPGTFKMGSDFGPKDQKPEIEREVQAPFALGRYEVTQAQWRACEAVGACVKRASEAPNKPIGGITWAEATAYVEWLSLETGVRYRLPTEIEWEYAALLGEADFTGGNAGHSAGPLAVGSFDADKNGLFDLIGNVWEWSSSCAMPYDAAEFGDGVGVLDCKRILRGGGWNSSAGAAKAKNRYARSQNKIVTDAGLRVARDLTPSEFATFAKE